MFSLVSEAKLRICVLFLSSTLIEFLIDLEFSQARNVIIIRPSFDHQAEIVYAALAIRPTSDVNCFLKNICMTVLGVIMLLPVRPR